MKDWRRKKENNFTWNLFSKIATLLCLMLAFPSSLTCIGCSIVHTDRTYDQTLVKIHIYCEQRFRYCKCRSVGK